MGRNAMKETIEAPALIEYGTVEELTQGGTGEYDFGGFYLEDF